MRKATVLLSWAPSSDEHAAGQSGRRPLRGRDAGGEDAG
jgi:hypothetical protein